MFQRVTETVPERWTESFSTRYRTCARKINSAFRSRRGCRFFRGRFRSQFRGRFRRLFRRRFRGSPGIGGGAGMLSCLWGWMATGGGDVERKARGERREQKDEGLTRWVGQRDGVTKGWRGRGRRPGEWGSGISRDMQGNLIRKVNKVIK